MSFDELGALPLAHHARPDRHEATKYNGADQKTHVSISKHLNLTLSRAKYDRLGWARERHVSVAIGELFANCMDQVAETNGVDGPSLSGVALTSGVRGHGHMEEHVTCIHNGKVILAEVVDVRNPLPLGPEQSLYFANEEPLAPNNTPRHAVMHFINYGAVIEDASKVLAIGDSTKHGKTNQIGMHGEGLKTAILRLLSVGIGVDIYCCMMLPGRLTPTVQRWHFFLSTRIGQDKGCLAVRTSWASPAEFGVRFTVSLTYNKTPYTMPYDGRVCAPYADGLGFDAKTYLVPAQCIRDRRPNDANDAGSFVPGVRGRLWAWHFFIKEDDRLCYAYDVFEPVGRDRDNVAWQPLGRAVARIWCTILADPTATDLHRLYWAAVRTPEGVEQTRYLEWCILSCLDDTACSVVANLFRETYPSHRYYPVAGGTAQEQAARRALPGFEIVVVSNALAEVLRSAYPTLPTFRDAQASALRAAPNVNGGTISRLTHMFPHAVFKAPASLDECRVTYVRDQEQNKLFINWTALLDAHATEERAIHVLVCTVLPEDDSTWSVTPLLFNPPPVVLIQDDDDDKEDDEGELTVQIVGGGGAPPSRKRAVPDAPLIPTVQGYKAVRCEWALIPNEK